MAGSNKELYGELMRATARGDAGVLEALIPRAKAEGTLNDNLLRIGLQNACKKGKTAAARLLLKEGAPTDLTGEKGSPALFWAVTSPQTKGHHEVTELLLSHDYPNCPADKEWKDAEGRPIFMAAAWRGHNEALKMLLDDGAKVNTRDIYHRTVLHNLAFDKKCRWNEETIRIILDRDINIDAQDHKSRTALHWAAATGKPIMVAQLVTRTSYRNANVNARTSRGKTALHLACRVDIPHNDRVSNSPMPTASIVDTLLSHGANPSIMSDGNWTCLHNTAKRQFTEQIAHLILENDPTLINARTSTGMTPLHVAAQFGNVHAVSRLLCCDGVKLNAKDAFYMTPMLRAAQGRHTDIVDLLSPSHHVNVSKLSQLARHTCETFEATVVDFRTNMDEAPLVSKRTISEVLYEKEADGSPKTTTTVHQIKRKPKAKPRFRWIHLPANNMAWAEALIAKAFIEGGASDVHGLKAAERAFSEQHRGEQYHSSFMRPLCQRADRGMREGQGTRSSTGQPGVRLSVTEHRALQESSPERNGGRERRRQRGNFGRTQSGGQQPLARISGSPAATPSPRQEAEGQEPETRPSGSDVATDPRAEDVRLSTPDRTPGSPRPPRKSRRQKQPPSGLGIANVPSPPSAAEDIRPLRPARTLSIPMSEISTRTADSRGEIERALPGSNIFFFMPYLHFETDRARRDMSEVVRNSAPKEHTEIKRPRKRFGSRPPNRWSRDEMLIHAYLHSTTGLHLRRTLDQFYLHGIDTSERDQDQVVGRYCESKGMEQKIFMVDQLWMWVLGPSLIITAFPNRWNQPKNDPLNVLDGIIEDINAKAGRPVETVHDLALLISARCAGSFDRHKPGDEDFQFLDMFESSIGNVNNQETDLYNSFYNASRKVHDWLRTNEQLISPTNNNYPRIVDRFLDIGEETRLLKEVKDIQDELTMIGMVLHQQRSVMEPFCQAICDDLNLLAPSAGSSRNQARNEVKRRVEEQKRLVDSDIAELNRMGRLAHGIEQSLINLLDLKQKQANAFEARFARDQAAGTVRQGQTILIFTVVTILFLPVSFMAQFFTINISRFERDGSNNLPLGYVLRYILGIGLGLSVFIISVAFMITRGYIGDMLRGVHWRELFGDKNLRTKSSIETLHTHTDRRRPSVGGLEANVRMSRYSREEKRSVAGSDYSSVVEPRALHLPEVMSTSPVSFRLRGGPPRDMEAR